MSESTGPCCGKVTIICLHCSAAAFPLLVPVGLRVGFKIYLLACRALRERQSICFSSTFATPLPSRSLRSYKGITLSAPRVKARAGAGAFLSCAPFFWSCLPLSVHLATSISTRADPGFWKWGGGAHLERAQVWGSSPRKFCKI